MELRQLVKEIQPGLEEQVITYLIYKEKKSWKYEIITCEESEGKVLSEYRKKYDKKAFLLNGYDSIVNYTQKEIRDNILYTYNLVEEECCNCSSTFKYNPDETYALYCDNCSKEVFDEYTESLKNQDYFDYIDYKDFS